MFAHTEIVIPPPPELWAAGDCLAELPWRIGRYVERTLAEVENREPEAFFDFYYFGDRYAGTKHVAVCDRRKLQTFGRWLRERKFVTDDNRVDPAAWMDPHSEQVRRVDEKWNEMFPSGRFLRCPLFARFGFDIHARGLELALPGDIMRLADVPRSLGCFRAIVADRSRVKNLFGLKLIDSVWMVTEDGCNAVDRVWDGSLFGALKLYKETHQGERADTSLPSDDWLSVTLCCHL